MVKNNKFTELRNRAQEFLKNEPEDIKEINPDDIKKVLKEFQVYQIELELQNEELIRVQSDLEKTKNKYYDLFNGAPVGYVVLGDTGLIYEANNTFMDLVSTKDQIRNEPFTNYIVDEDRNQFLARYKAFFKDPKNKSFELRMKSGKKDYFWANIKAMPGAEHTDINRIRKNDQLLVTISDVTEKKKAEIELQAQKDYLAVTLNSIGDAVVTTDTDGNLVELNPIATQLTGWTAEEARGKHLETVLDLYDSRSGKKVQTPVAQVLEKKEIVTMSNHTMLVSKDKSKYQIADSAAPIQTDQGVLLGTVLVFRDVTQEYKYQQERYEHSRIIKQISDMVFSADVNGIIQFANDSVYEVLGVSKEEYEKTPKSVFDIDTADGIEPQVIAKVCKKDSFWRGKEISSTKDGKKLIFDTRIQTIINEDGKLVGYIRISTDITEQTKAQVEILLSRDKLRSYINNAPFGIFVLNSKKEIAESNKAFEKILYATKSGLILNSIFDFIAEESKSAFTEHLEKLSENGTSAIECYLQRNDETTRLCSLVCTIINKDSTLCFINDITEERLLENEIQKIAKLESLGILAGGIAHNFKNILASMSLSIDLARLKPDKTDTYLNNISKNISYATALASKFQTFTKTYPLLLKPVRIDHLLENAADIALSGSYSRAEYVHPDKTIQVMADEKQISEAFLNIILNAEQAMPKGGRITITSEMVEIDEKKAGKLKAGNYLKVKIIDSGEGIDEKNLDEIFTPFYSTRPQGNGLGLTSALRIVENHEGSISVESRLGKGTTVSILLPIAYSVKQVSDEPKVTINKEKKVRALLLDDNLEIIRNMNELTDYLDNIDLNCFYDPEIAINDFESSFEHNPYDMVILDIVLVGFELDGLDVLEKIRKINPNIKALVFSGHSKKPIVSRYKEYGFDGILEKPCTIQSLERAVKEMLRK
jgi:two-component system cell cycle sensor histidine kinase/response regulator CckA